MAVSKRYVPVVNANLRIDNFQPFKYKDALVMLIMMIIMEIAL